MDILPPRRIRASGSTCRKGRRRRPCRRSDLAANCSAGGLRRVPGGSPAPSWRAARGIPCSWHRCPIHSRQAAVKEAQGSPRRRWIDKVAAFRRSAPDLMASCFSRNCTRPGKTCRLCVSGTAHDSLHEKVSVNPGTLRSLILNFNIAGPTPKCRSSEAAGPLNKSRAIHEERH